MRVRELAGLLGAEFEGDGEIELTGVAPIESAGPHELSFVNSRKAALHADESGAGCLIAPAGLELPGRSMIRAASPRGLFARAIALLCPAPRPEAGVHATAVVAPGARIGEGASIGPHCSIGRDVTIGAGSVLHANVTIYDNVTIGAHCVLHSGCVIGADGFGFVLEGGRYEKFPQVGRVE